MKKLFFVICAVAVLLSSCATITLQPHQANTYYPTSGDYKILGRVTMEQETGKASYAKLLEAAKEKYSDCDDIVNVIVDVKKEESKILFFVLKEPTVTYTMSAIAIDYTDI